MEKEAQLRKWAAQRLSAMLQLSPEECSEIVEHIMSFDDAEELKGELGAFLAEASAEYKIKSFVEELFERKRGPSAPTKGKGKEAATREEGSRGAKGGKGSDGRDSRDSKGDRGAKRSGGDEVMRLSMPMHAKDKTDKRLIVIDAASGRHKVLTNCMNCGKVVVEEEGWGPCLFCGNPLELGDNFGLRHGDDRGFIEPVGKPSREEEKFNSSFERAKATKDRLLSYDRDAKKRTKVFDDATDWYSESQNAWLTEAQREDAVRKAKEEERKKREEKRKIHAKIDIFGRTVVSADAEAEEEMDKKSKAVFEEWTESVTDSNLQRDAASSKKKQVSSNSSAPGANSQLCDSSRMLYDKLRASLHAASKDLRKASGFSIQENNDGDPEADVGSQKKSTRWDSSIDADREDVSLGISSSDFAQAAAPNADLLPVDESPYEDEEDIGQCVSMHQPWASLLVHGLRFAEARSWRTTYRGRLWIHATGKPPDNLQVDTEEQKCRSLYEALGVPAPHLPSEGSGYPTDVLIGCVDMEACWTRGEYAEILNRTACMLQESISSEYVFWCVRPRRLAVPVKMGGDNKFWRLPLGLLPAAQRGLQPVRWPGGQQSLAFPELPPRSAASRAALEHILEEDEGGEPLLEAAAASAPRSAGSRQRGLHAATATTAVKANTQAKASGGDATFASAPGFDLWPASVPGAETLQVLEKDRDADRDAVVLQNGFVQLVGFVPIDLQQRIIDELRQPGLSSKGFDNAPIAFEGFKKSQGAPYRMYLGLGWNANSAMWEAPEAAVPSLSKMLLDLYAEAVKRANRELARAQHRKRKMAPFPEGRQPSHGVVTFCPASASVALHQAGTESKDSLEAGLPLIGICIGDSCEFAYSSEAPDAMRGKPKVFRLESGDVYLLGGESRLLWHGVNRIIPRTSPPLRLAPGRLEVTLRVQ